MALARGVAIQPLDFQIPTLQLPFEQLYDQMQKMQQEKDLFDVMKTMKPQFVEGDKAIVEAGLKEVQGMVSNVAQAFASGKTTDAMRELRDAKTVLTSMWSPTGVFGGVQDYYKETQKALAEIDEFTKDNTDPAYRYVYKDMVRQSIKEGSGIDPITGKRRTVVTPDMTKEINVLKEADDYLTNWKSDTRTGIERRKDGYFWIGTTEQVSATELSKAMDDFMSNPRIANALDIQAKYRLGIGGEQGITELKTNFEKEITTSHKSQQERIKQLDKLLNGTKQEIKSAQVDLNLTPTGVYDEQTKKAFLDFKEQNSETKLQEQLDIVRKADPGGLYKHRLQMDLKDAVVPKHSFIKENGKLMADQVGLEQMKISAYRKMLAEFKTPAQVPLVAPLDVAELNIPSPIQMRDLAKSVYDNAVKLSLNNMPPDLQESFKSVNKKYAVTAEYFNEAVSKGLRAAGVQDIESIGDDQAKKLAFKKAFSDVLSTPSYGIKEGMRVGGKEGGKTFSDIADVFLKGGNRYWYTTFQTENTLRDSYNEYSSTQHTVDYITDNVLGDKDSFNKFYEFARAEEVRSIGGPVIFPSMLKWNTPEKLQAAIKSKDPNASKVFQDYLDYTKNNNPNLYKKISGGAIVYGVEQPNIREIEENLLKSIQNSNLLAYIDISTVDQKAKDFIVDRKGRDRKDYKINTAKLASMNTNGTNQPMLVVNVSRGEGDNLQKETITVPATGIKNKSWVKSHMILQAATSFNFETMQPTNPEVFYASLDMMYDLENSSGSAFNAANLVRRMQQYDNKAGAYKLGSVEYGNNLLDVLLTVDSVNNKQLAVVFPPDTPGGRESAINIGIGNNTLDEAITAIRNIKANLQFPIAMPEIMSVATTLKKPAGDKEAFIQAYLAGAMGQTSSFDSGDDEE